MVEVGGGADWRLCGMAEEVLETRTDGFVKGESTILQYGVGKSSFNFLMVVYNALLITH